MRLLTHSRVALLLASAIAAAIAACASFSGNDAPSGPGAADSGTLADAPPLTEGATPSDDAGAGLLPTGLRGYWRLDGDGRSTTAEDGIELVVKGATFVDAGFGGAMRCLGGATATVDDPRFDFTNGQGTLVVWAHIDADAAVNPLFRTIASKGTNWSAPTMTPGYGLGYSAGGSAITGVVADGVTWSPVVGTTTLTDGKFHMIAYAVDPTSERLYVDGQLVNNAKAVPPDGSVSSKDPLTLCSKYAYDLDGMLDELMIFDHGLTSVEIGAVKTYVEQSAH